MTTIEIHTDGACAGNQKDENIGGWGTILLYGDHRKELWGGELNTTNNRMELTALIQGFSALKKSPLTVNVFSDSAYLVDCFNKGWYEKWQRNGWMTAARKPVENQDLWVRLIGQVQKHQVSFYRIKGHLNLDAAPPVLRKAHADFQAVNGPWDWETFLRIAGENKRADELANCFIKAHRQNQKQEEGEDPMPSLTPPTRPALLFDLDGTLWDAAPQVAKAWNKTLEKHPDLDLRFTTAMVRQSMGKQLEEIAAIWLPQMDPKERLALFDQAAREEIDYVRQHPGKLFPALRKTLKELQSRYDLYIVSNSQEGYIESFLAGTKLGPFFLDYECAGRTGRPKGDNILLVMERNQLDRCLYIGDTQKDYEATLQAGIPFVHAAYGFGTIQETVPAIAAFADLVDFARVFFGS